MPVAQKKNGSSAKGVSTAGAAGLLAVGLIAGFVAGKMMASPKEGAVNAPADAGTYQQGYADAKKEIEDLRLLSPEPEQLTELSGSVVEVRTSSFTMRVDPTVLNPLIKDVPEIREVRVTTDTVITTQVLRDRETYQKELAAYDKKYAADIAANKTVPDAPSPYETKTLTLKDLNESDHVIVKADHDVKREAVFDAVSVEIGFESTTPEMPAIPENRPPAPTDNRPPPPKEGEPPPPLPPTQ